MVSPRDRRAMAAFAIGRGLSQRRASLLCSTPRSGLGYRSRRDRRDRHLIAALRIVARREPSWGYRLVAGYLRLRGWRVNVKRIHRLWRLHGLSLRRLRKRRKIRTGATVRPVARTRNDVWAWDVVHDRYGAGEPFRCLTVKDEATAYCLAIETGRHLRSEHIEGLLRRLIAQFGRPKAIRSDNGSELIADSLKEVMRKQGIQSIQIDPGKPWQNGSNESFNGTLRRECLDAELFGSLTEARVVIEAWRRKYNEVRPHSGLSYLTPARVYYGMEEGRRTGT